MRNLAYLCILMYTHGHTQKREIIDTVSTRLLILNHEDFQEILFNR